MKCYSQTIFPAPTRLTSPTTSALILFTFIIGSVSVVGSDTIRVEGPGRVTLPEVEVKDSQQTVYSGSLTLDLTNKSELNGWLLTGEIAQNALIGSYTEEQIPAALSFKSITWISGGNGSAAGITVYPDGQRIEADPGFGVGKYKIEFEIRYDVPPFPAADRYDCVSTFIVQ
ncbi:hypothetical protein [Pelagicoccus mobilis]|uniref:Uncharacterized protein n=1 Tax=Pelagicoccus mobilis TaxID=415221 RepID=A0A934S273_9BACT|nr:hypothetical protein [Pelagicoccus mobilis]MBK1879825.1 hypothetical protein [Pelagicoccus mobilis]